MSEAQERAACWLCARPLGEAMEWHHPVPKAKGGRIKVPVHPVCHRVIHANLANGVLRRIGADVAALRADPGLGAFLAWVSDKPPDFHVATHRRRDA
jgi:hypothetical protein